MRVSSSGSPGTGSDDVHHRMRFLHDRSPQIRSTGFRPPGVQRDPRRLPSAAAMRQKPRLQAPTFQIVQRSGGWWQPPGPPPPAVPGGAGVPGLPPEPPPGPARGPPRRPHERGSPPGPSAPSGGGGPDQSHRSPQAQTIQVSGRQGRRPPPGGSRDTTRPRGPTARASSAVAPPVPAADLQHPSPLQGGQEGEEEPPHRGLGEGDPGNPLEGALRQGAPGPEGLRVLGGAGAATAGPAVPDRGCGAAPPGCPERPVPAPCPDPRPEPPPRPPAGPPGPARPTGPAPPPGIPGASTAPAGPETVSARSPGSGRSRPWRDRVGRFSQERPSRAARIWRQEIPGSRRTRGPKASSSRRARL